MPWKDDSAIHSLRLAYNAAVAAHENCARALIEALMRGDEAPAELVEAEATTRRQRDEARTRLHAAMARSIGPPPESPERSR